MKQSIYQKLLLSLAIVAFFGTIASTQVLTRSQVDYEQIQTEKQMMSALKAKANAKGLTTIPKEWIQKAKEHRAQRLTEVRTARTSANHVEKEKAAQKTSKVLVENRFTEEELIRKGKVENRTEKQQKANIPDAQVGNNSYVISIEPKVNNTIKKDVRIIPPSYPDNISQDNNANKTKGDDASQDNEPKKISAIQFSSDYKPKTKEERRQEILKKLSTTTNEEEIKKCKAILESLK